MRQRFYSPQLKIALPTQRPGNNRELRSVGSSTHLFCHIEKNNFQQQIGPYVYNKNHQLGSGYSSKVYLGRKKCSNQQFAIKVIQLKKYSKSNVQMLQNQIEILKSLNHPNIIRCYDIFKNSDKCFIVTQYCPHGDLLKYITKKGRLCQKNTTQIIGDVVEGYKYLISQKILHRDLKPANILKGKNNWKIADFGFSLRSQYDIKTKYNVGTPLYMPPQSLINNIYSVKSDLFAIGIMIYELMIGCTPWQSRTEKELIKKIACVPFKIPQKYTISEKLKKLMNVLCQVNSVQRMNKFEFLSLELKYSERQKKFFNTQAKRKNTFEGYRATSAENIHQKYKKISQLHYIPLKNMQSQSTNQNQQQQDYDIKKIYSKNQQILNCQINYVKFIHTVLNNCKNLPLNTVDQHHKLDLILYKHILKIIKHLTDSKNNWFKLKNYQQYKRSSSYINIYLNITDLAPRYEKQYMALLKNVSIPVVKQANQQFSQLAYSNSFSKIFYQKIIFYISGLIRKAQNNIDQILSSNKGILTTEISSSIQSLKFIYKYYKLISMSFNQFQNYQFFQLKCDVKFYIDYRRISINTISEFLQLKNQLKDI